MDSLKEFLTKDIRDKSIPFYKKKLFLISSGILISIILIIVIVLASSSPSESSESSPSLKSSVSTISYNYQDFKESKKFKNNPDQGFYRPVKVTITPTSLTNQTNYPEQMYHLRCDISQFSGAVNGDRDIELTQTALDKIDEYLSKIKSENKNAIIRFAYDPGYAGNKNLEPSIEMIEKHIQKLGPILNKHKHTLTAIEAGMLGPWGEMHSSDFITEEIKAKVFHYWLQNTNGIPVMARTPKAMFVYFGKSLDEIEKYEIKEGEEGYYLGLFNDCYLSSVDDYGTYTYDRTREINWLSKQNEHLPFGGETCDNCDKSNLDYAIPEMYKLGLSYLNIEFSTDVINKWKNLEYNSALGKDSLFYGVTGYDYIKAHFGYRLVIRSLTCEYQKGKDFNLVINIDNVGFGNLLKEKMVDIIYTDMQGEIISRKNVGKYKGENKLAIKGELLSEEHEDYQVFIKIYGFNENNKDYYYIQFANDDIFNENLKATYAFKVLKGGEINH